MRWFPLFLIITILPSCTIYSSSGRKEFETKSPAYIKTSAFVGCDNLEMQDDPDFLDGFSARSFYRDEHFFVAEETGSDFSGSGPLVQVVDLKNDKICTYQFNDTNAWEMTKPYLLQHLP